ncbi:uncharacterized protein MONOS_2149 [Monocercomonoides exilis]|uniref:uncharacterized protein n=1 Tax=Monocercomonoides exilis TaxID=2049356 RepID=UPI0035593B8A|nr:hypothetical protein MONOS_2149 [Monocercomonoides exilis]|eukprot:MONOS_2149.1-p1 / transcript=MONOS_2149.1 / gene=MONOS_2149 / organism=Monocercomonoides_exilis_PA203 / gene_product=unspecified product / transcript_product=unspecified product / location=Mono_scaffold00042:138584-139882(+) / protein_length=231 / sequence_SO=supercontig / SO=protein_coding / is_pseudo=false
MSSRFNDISKVQHREISPSVEFYEEIVAVSVPCLLKVALNKGESEEVQKEVEMALMAMSNVVKWENAEEELYLDEITEIIQYHEEHHNLTQLAYQSAWQLLINRFIMERRFEDVIMNDLHFVRETEREFEELSRCVDWKRNDGEKGKKEKKEVQIIRNWINLVSDSLEYHELWEEGNVGVIRCLVALCRAAREKEQEVFGDCLCVFNRMSRYSTVGTDVLLKHGIEGKDG